MHDGCAGSEQGAKAKVQTPFQSADSHGPSSWWKWSGHWICQPPLPPADDGGREGTAFSPCGAARLPSIRYVPELFQLTLVGRALRFPKVDDQPPQHAREAERHAVSVVLRHRRAGILAHVKRLVQREAQPNRPFDAPLGD